MPAPTENRSEFYEAFTRALEDVRNQLEKTIAAAMEQQGFSETLRTLRKLERGQLPAAAMMTVHDGVVEKLPSGGYTAALDTSCGPLLLTCTQYVAQTSIDPQVVDSGAEPTDVAPAEKLLQELVSAGSTPSARLICAVELTQFGHSHYHVLLSRLWQYILDHRDSNDRDELIAVGAAIRKYIAIMPIDRMGELATLLDSTHRAPLSVELEIEVAKMVYRNFETHPPTIVDPHPDLAQRFWEMVLAYINPRILLRDKHSAAASLAIEAIIAMRSSLSERAMRKAAECPHVWFAELVCDDLNDLHEAWSKKKPDAASWLNELQRSVFTPV